MVHDFSLFKSLFEITSANIKSNSWFSSLFYLALFEIVGCLVAMSTNPHMIWLNHDHTYNKRGKSLSSCRRQAKMILYINIRRLTFWDTIMTLFSIRVKLSEKKIILYGGNFNTTSLHNQKVDVHHKKRSKAEELGAKAKNFLAG